MPIKPGTAFWMENERNSREHLNVVISKPNEKGMVLLVNFSHYYTGSRQNHCQDKSCVLGPSDYEALSKQSFVKYDDAVEDTVENIEKQLGFGEYIACASVSPELLQRIQLGAKISSALKYKFHAYFKFF